MENTFPKESLRKVSAFIALYARLIIAERVLEDLVLLNQQDVETFEHMLTEGEKIESEDLIYAAKQVMTKEELVKLKRLVLTETKDMMGKLSEEDQLLLANQVRELTKLL